MSAGGGISLPFTAIRAESLSSLGPLHCAAQPSQPSLRPQSEGKGQDLEMALAPTPKNLCVVSEVKLNSVALSNSGGGRLFCFANATSQVRQRQQPLRLAPP